MPNLNINFTSKPASVQQQFSGKTPYDNRIGFWGMVVEVHAEDCTVHVRMDTGRVLTGLRVASFEWVTIDKDKDYLSGERHLPPVNTFVFCLMPTGTPESAFVLCSGFAHQDAQHSEFKDKEKGSEHEIHENSGWKKITKYEDGSKLFQNKVKDGDETIKLQIDQSSKGEEIINAIVHSHELTIDKDKVEYKNDNKPLKIDTDKNKFELDGRIELTARDDDLIKIGNQISTLGEILDELCTALMKLYTTINIGPLPHNHYATDWANSMIRPVKEKANKVFEI